jgi:hypothetical protein
MSGAADAAGRRDRWRTWLVRGAGAVGLALLIYLVAELGATRIASQLHGLWSILPVILAITAMKYPLQTAGWRLVLPVDARPSWGASIAATIAGDALGYVTWAGPFTGEPIRALLVRDAVPVAAGTAAGAIERGMYNVTAALLVWVVLFVLVSATHTAALVAAVAASAIGLGLLVRYARRRVRPPGPSPVSTADRAPAPRPDAEPASRIGSFFGAVRDLWQRRRGVLPALTLLCLTQHAVLVAEAYLILSALSGGTTLQTALVFEAVTKIVNTAGLIIPGRLGVAEGGSALLADALGFAASHGLSLALMRRIRALIWSAVGLSLLPIREARLRRPR